MRNYECENKSIVALECCCIFAPLHLYVDANPTFLFTVFQSEHKETLLVRRQKKTPNKNQLQVNLSTAK
ncbi:hypothetical protein SUGI_0193620 [Cryptomeria japonica]|nr:hypothetical protein SUGI_0193620 [Cryptomeria japonica]